MKICDGKKGSDGLPKGTVFATQSGDLFIKGVGNHSTALTGPAAGLTRACNWYVTAVYPNACINPGEPE